MKREYENENEEKANQKVSECLNWMTYFSEQKPRITWRINEKPSQEKMEDFLKEILELTEEGADVAQSEKSITGANIVRVSDTGRAGRTYAQPSTDEPANTMNGGRLRANYSW